MTKVWGELSLEQILLLMYHNQTKVFFFFTQFINLHNM